MILIEKTQIIGLEPPLHECGVDIGPNDLDLILRLTKVGSVDSKFRRMIARENGKE